MRHKRDPPTAILVMCCACTYRQDTVNDSDFAATPSSTDWSVFGATTLVQDHGHCGSCWAYSTTEGNVSYTCDKRIHRWWIGDSDKGVHAHLPIRRILLSNSVSFSQVHFNEVCVAKGAVGRFPLCFIILVQQLFPQCRYPNALVVVWLKATRSQTDLHCCFTHFSICQSFCLIAVVADIKDSEWEKIKKSCRHSCLHRTQSRIVHYSQW